MRGITGANNYLEEAVGKREPTIRLLLCTSRLLLLDLTHNYLEEAVGKRENSSGQMAWLHLAIPAIGEWFLLNNNNGDGMVALCT